MRHVPNILSCLRILLIPVFVWQLLIGNTTAAAVILAGS
ncbi:MAG: CDP-alcohol phosphatidyltransferase family protein, partial [Oscillospiraceae bacterium]